MCIFVYLFVSVQSTNKPIIKINKLGLLIECHFTNVHADSYTLIKFFLYLQRQH